MRMQSLSGSMIFAIVAGVVLILVFLVLLVVILRRESARARERQRDLAARASLRGKTRPGPSAWDGTDSSRGARQQLKARQMDTDLPPLKMETTDWGANGPESSDAQARFTGSQPAGGVYRTGFNPFYKNEGAIKVEEVADMVQQAELMITLENYPVAMNMLTRHIRETEKPVPKAWLLLFDLFIKTGRREQYDNLAKGFRALFNARVPSWEVQQSDELLGLESYGTVVGKVQRLWGLPTCRAFLESLLYDDRGGARQGFTLLAYSEILDLIDLIDTSDAMEEEFQERRAIELKLQADPPR